MHREIMQKTDSIKELEEQIEVMTEEMAKVGVITQVVVFRILNKYTCSQIDRIPRLEIREFSTFQPIERPLAAIPIR